MSAFPHEHTALERLRSALPLPVVLTLLYVGLVRLAVLPAWAAGVGGADLMRGRTPLGPALLQILLGVNALLLIYLGLACIASVRERRAARGVAVAAHGGAVALVLYLSWVVIRLGREPGGTILDFWP